jgi:hypothetical protein
MFKCLECGRKFRTAASAERASIHGCPNCGGVDIDLDMEVRPEPIRTCLCGSGEVAYWVHDARNIPLAKVCSQCREEKLSHFRDDVLTDPDYPTDEPIEPDGGCDL